VKTAGTGADLAGPVAAPLPWWRLWHERWLARRDGWLASPAFHRWASTFAFTRPIARRQAQALFDLVAGFVYSQVLLACVRLRLFEVLAAGPATPAELAPRLGLSLDATQRLLSAATSLRLLQTRSQGRYGLGPLGAPMVGNTAVAAMVEHHAALYADLADPVALLRGQAPAAAALAQYWPYAGTAAPSDLPAERVAVYSALMSASQPLVADQILDAYSLAPHRCLLDVGGGEGRFLASAARRAPGLKLMLFDLPAVAERAKAQLANQGLDGRATCFGGSFFGDALPRGADVASLVRVIHDHDDAAALAIVRAVHDALPPGGVLMLAEPMAGTPGSEAVGDAYFGFYLLAMGSGRARSVQELTALLQAAGFEAVRQVPTRMPLQTGLLLARRTTDERKP
jgi:demethylspheroidene O-methyltransferase